MAVFRGVEGGYAVVRAANQGRLTISDPLGRIVGETSSGAVPMALVTADVELGAGPTVYAYAGDWFAWLCAAATLVIVRLRLSRRSRTDT